MPHVPAEPPFSSRYLAGHRASAPWPTFAPWWRALVCLVLGSLCLPAGTTTLVRCQINHKIVYSDSDCPADASRRSGFAGMPTSRPITIRFPRNKAGSVSTRKKAGPH